MSHNVLSKIKNKNEFGTMKCWCGSKQIRKQYIGVLDIKFTCKRCNKSWIQSQEEIGEI